MNIKYISDKKIHSVFKKRPIKSGYYNDPVNHPDGGGTCDYCGTDVAGGDGYEPDFESSFETARGWLYVYLTGGDEDNYYYAPEGDWEFANWLGGDWSDDDIRDVEQEIIGMAFNNGDYMCSNCLTKRIKEAAEKWVEENW